MRSLILLVWKPYCSIFRSYHGGDFDAELNAQRYLDGAELPMEDSDVDPFNGQSPENFMEGEDQVNGMGTSIVFNSNFNTNKLCVIFN